MNNEPQQGWRAASRRSSAKFGALMLKRAGYKDLLDGRKAVIMNVRREQSGTSTYAGVVETPFKGGKL